MSYAIQYGGKTPTVPRHRSRRKRVLIAALIIAILLLSIQYLWPEGQEAVWRLLLPGADASAVDAIEGFFSQVVSGEDVSEVFSAFCTKVVSNAQLPG